MELKQLKERQDSREDRLLIVPYGIETSSLACSRGRRRLLIVPYGIETKERKQHQAETSAF